MLQAAHARTQRLPGAHADAEAGLDAAVENVRTAIAALHALPRP